MLPKITNKTVIRRSDELLGCMIDDEIALMSIENGEYYQLNKQASFIWNSIETPKIFSEIISDITDKFEVEQGVCETETIDFLIKISEDGLAKLD